MIKMVYIGVKCKNCGITTSTHINGYCITCHYNGEGKSVHDEFVENVLEALRRNKNEYL